MQDSSPRPASTKRSTGGATAKEAPKTLAQQGAAAQFPTPNPGPDPAPVAPHATTSTGREQRSGLASVATEPMVALTVRGWMRLARARYLLLTVAPVLVAAAWLWSQGRHITFGLLTLTVLSAALAQTGAQLLAVGMNGARNQRTAQTIVPSMLTRVAVVVLAVSACLGLPLVAAGGTPVLLVGGAALLVAVGYAATPFIYRRLPLGEVVVGLVSGPGLVALIILAQRQPVTPFVLALGAGLGLFAAAVVEAANLRTLAAGARAERYSLARLLGLRGGRLLYLATVAAAYLVVLIAALWRGAPHGALAVLFSLPVAVLPLTGALRGHAAALVPVVTGTLRAYVYFAFWVIIGLLLGAIYLHLLRIAGS